jgi:hypothetical protein
LPIYNISGCHDDVRLNFAQLGDDAHKKFITQHHAEVQVGNLRDGHSTDGWR